MLRLVRRLAHSPVRVGARCCLDPRYTSPQTASRTRTSPAAASRSEAGSRPSPSSPHDAARSILPPSVRSRLRHLTSSTCSRRCARAERSSFTAAAAGTARARSRRESNSCLPERSSACSWHHGNPRAFAGDTSNKERAEDRGACRGSRILRHSSSSARGSADAQPTWRARSTSSTTADVLGRGASRACLSDSRPRICRSLLSDGRESLIPHR